MWPSLNANANAIEAISAGLTVAVTAVLVVMTARYVRLTKALVDVALAQLQAQHEALKARRRELQASVNFLSLAMASLPNSEATHRMAEMLRLGRPIRWDDFDFGRFRTLAAELSPRAGGSAAAVEANMNWLASQMENAEMTPPWGRWSEALTEIFAALAQISNEAKTG